MKTWFVGDIHGCSDQLAEVLSRVPRQDRLVFLGDYVNRGPSSKGVLASLLATQESTDAVFVAGNHDLEMLRVLDGGPIERFLRMGGAPTIRSYVDKISGNVADDFRAAVPAAHATFLRNLVPYFADSGLQILGAHDHIPIPAGWVGIFGHRPTATSLPSVELPFIHIDTGCGTTPSGVLSAFSHPTGELIQSRPWV